jgi:hypothetical protein
MLVCCAISPKKTDEEQPEPAKILRTPFRSQEQKAFRNGVSKFDNLAP